GAYMFSLIFLSSGLFMGWSLGANDAANIFGTAVGTKMVRFRTAAIISCLFITLGAVIAGSGASHGLGALGVIDQLPGAFVLSLCAAVTVMWMTKSGLPVSTSQAIVGAIVGWNFFTGRATDMRVLTRIIGTWIYGPILAGIFAALLFIVVRKLVNTSTVHLLLLDRYTRNGLLLAGAFGAFSLGANNIANVMGVFIGTMDLPAREFFMFSLSGEQQLFLLGGIAISVGVVTYSKRVMMTVGNNLFKLSPVSAFVVVLATSMVLFLFSSTTISEFLLSRGLPALPLIPVSQSQACVGAVLGIGMVKGGWRTINFPLLGRIALGWIATPIVSALLAYILLFFMQNVFLQPIV
ncbi:MAG TPA: inorganic phosphate transporter, partial [Sphaerochaetaceae bacterium]|nr:inorganic phosphate transporter [Sphaerochaetaceae bacterium]